MKKSYLIVAVLVTLGGGYWYYQRRSKQIAQAQLNPNASLNSQLGQQAAGYDRATGQIGDTRTSNNRYNQYLDWLKTGGTDSGKSFDQYLTASQPQTLPMNT